jgi:hypothetical protein
VSVYGSPSSRVILSPGLVAGGRVLITAAMSSVHDAELIGIIDAAPKRLASPATVAPGEQRSL